MATYLLEMEKRLQAAQSKSEKRIVDSQPKRQFYKIMFFGTGIGFTAFTLFEMAMRMFGYGITKL